VGGGREETDAPAVNIERAGLGSDRIPYPRSNISAAVIPVDIHDIGIYMPPHVVMGGEGEGVNKAGGRFTKGRGRTSRRRGAIPMPLATKPASSRRCHPYATPRMPLPTPCE